MPKVHRPKLLNTRKIKQFLTSFSYSLFESDAKFDSGTGWPSFTDPVSANAVKLIEDNSHGIHRTEVQCANCGAHLGHVFPDGPERANVEGEVSGRHDRFCINGICLDHQAI